MCEVLPFNATADEMKAALDSISALGMVHVTKSAAEEFKSRWVVTFASNGGNLELVVANTTLLRGSGRAFVVEEVVPGSIPLQGKFI